MEYLSHGITLELSPGAFPLSTDSMALAGFARLPKNARVLDLGSGCGTLGLLLCAGREDCSITGIELSAQAHQMAMENARRNGLSHRLTSLCADVREVPSFLEPGSFDVCISNPPYFTGGFRSTSHGQARHTDTCPTGSLMAAAKWALRYGSDFFLVHKPEMLAQLCHLASVHGLEPKHLKLLRHREGGNVSLILLQCRKGGKPGLTLTEDALWQADGSPTSYCRALYHKEVAV